MTPKKYYTQVEVDEYVRRLLTDSEIALSKQAERIEKEVKEKQRLLSELEDFKTKEKSISRLLVLSERKSKFLETTTRSKCAIEIERLARLAEKWDEFFNNLSNKYEAEDKAKLEEFKNDLSKAIDNMLEMESLFTSEPLSEAEKAHAEEVNRLNILRNKKKSQLDDRFSKLVMEFNMKIGDNATRGRGRPKKQEANNINAIEKKLTKDTIKEQTQNIDDGVFNFNEALHPVDSLEDILNDLLNG